MARSISTIYNSIITEKETMSSLDGLLPTGTTYTTLLADITSASKVAVWRLMCYIVAAAIYTHELLWDAFKIEITTLVESNRFGTLPWYVTTAKRFQYGDTLTLVGDFPGYEPVTTANQIVKHASATEGGGIVYVKVAKTVSNALAALTNTELTSFRAYMAQMKPAGIPVICSSQNADLFRVNMEITYDAILPSATVLANVKAAINAYLAALPFDAKFRRLAFEDALQAVPGVLGIAINSMTGVQGLTQTAITQDYIAAAGYMTYDDLNSSISLQT
jgi:hypothetical protein